MPSIALADADLKHVVDGLAVELMAFVVHLGVLTTVDTSCAVHPHLVVLGFAIGVERDADALWVYEGEVEFLVDVLIGTFDFVGLSSGAKLH